MNSDKLMRDCPAGHRRRGRRRNLDVSGEGKHAPLIGSRTCYFASPYVHPAGRTRTNLQNYKSEWKAIDCSFLILLWNSSCPRILEYKIHTLFKNLTCISQLCISDHFYWCILKISWNRTSECTLSVFKNIFNDFYCIGKRWERIVCMSLWSDASKAVMFMS